MPLAILNYWSSLGFANNKIFIGFDELTKELLTFVYEYLYIYLLSCVANNRKHEDEDCYGSQKFSETKNLDEFLLTLSVVEPNDKTNYQNTVVSGLHKNRWVDSQGKLVDDVSPEIKIWFKEVSGFGIETIKDYFGPSIE